MAYERIFDEESTRAGALACINDGFGMYPYGLSVGTSIASLEGVTPGIYRVFLAGMDAAQVVVVMTTDTPMTGVWVLPDPGGGEGVDDRPFSLFPGNVVERIRVLPIQRVVNAQISSGTGMLYLVPVVPG